MRICIENHAIVLNEIEELKPSQVSQLQFFGFQKSKGVLFCSDNQLQDLDDLLRKVVKFFDKNEIKYSATGLAQDMVNEINISNHGYKDVVKKGDDFKNGNFDVQTFNTFNDFALSLPRVLKEHQLKAAFHLYLVRNGANFSVPGSGKTSTVLSVYEKLRLEGDVNMLFVIGPPSCFAPWRTEFKDTLGRIPRCQLLAGGKSEERKMKYYETPENAAELQLTTFHTLTNDLEEAVFLLSRKEIKAFLVIDEAHYIKRIGGRWATAILKVGKAAHRRCILTGTPLPRSHIDVFNLFDFLWPDVSALDENSKSKIYFALQQKDFKAATTILKEKMGPLYYRVRKSDLHLKDPIFHQPVLLKMNVNEKKIYDLIAKKIGERSKEEMLSTMNVTDLLKRGRIMRLRQAATYVKLLNSAIEGYAENLLSGEKDIISLIQNYDSIEMPAKLEKLLVMLTEFQENKQKVVIWSNFRGSLQLIQRVLDEHGYYSKMIYGDIPRQIQTDDDDKHEIEEEETRERIRNEFVDPNSGLDVLIANPAACAESISLHKTCQNAVYYDLSYNCAQFLQSLDRIHRVGGSETKTANYFFLQYADSIDQDIKDNLDRKSEVMYSIVESDFPIYSSSLHESDEQTAYDRIVAT